MVLAISLLAVLVFLVLPLAKGREASSRGRFGCFTSSPSDLGYILVEIAFIQRFVLFLGHPVYALTVVVFLLLLSSGAGSMVSRWWLAETSRVWLPLRSSPPLCCCMLPCCPACWDSLVGLPFLAKLPGQRRAAGSVGLRHGHAVSYRPARPGRPQPC